MRECLDRRDYAQAHRLICEANKLSEEVSALMAWYRRHAA
jgi:hypothetical protein